MCLVPFSHVQAFCLYAEVTCVRFSCLVEMFTPQPFFRTEYIEGGGSHGPKSGSYRAEFPHHIKKEKIICNEYKG